MPDVHISWLAGRTVDQKRKVVEGITKVLMEEAGAKPESTHIVFIDIPHTPGPAGPSTHLNGLIWLMPVMGNAGYHWSGTQIIVGNLYAVFGLAFLIATLVYLAATGQARVHRVSG